MISGKVQKIEVEPFKTKAGNEMFKVFLVVNDVSYTTISKFADVRIKAGDEVFFEVQEDYPNSIQLGTLKKGKTAFKTTAKPISDIEDKFKMLEARVKKLEDARFLDDDIPL